MPWFWQAFFLLIFTVPLIILFAYAAWDVVRRKDAGAAFKALWLLGFCVFPVIGPLLYLVIRSPGSDAEAMALAEERAGAAGMPAAASVREQRGGQVL
jgi:hypothetical protein